MNSQCKLCDMLVYIQIISCLRALLSKCPSLELRDAAAQFLGKCGNKEAPESNEVRKIYYVITVVVLEAT